MSCRTIVARRLLLCVALVLLYCFANSSVWAVTPGTCSVATLKGAFGDFGQGTVLVDMGFGPPPFPALVAGALTYDGAGHYTSTFWGSFAGISFQSTDDGTYTVDSDCTTILHSPDTNTHSSGVITGDGMRQEVHLVYTDVSVFSSDTLKKIPEGECSLRSLTGSYLLFGEGTFAPAGTALQSNHVGTITFDGAGKWSGRETVNIIGTPSFESEIFGTYAVNNDCTVTAEIVSPAIGVLHEAGVITGAGINQEAHVIVTDFGWSFADTLKRQ